MAELTVDENINVPETRVRSPFEDAWREFRRNRIAVLGLIYVILIVLVAIFAPLITPYHFAHQDTRNGRAKPLTGYIVAREVVDESCHWANTPIEWGCSLFLFGSDALGRDLWTRVVYGTRVSLSVAVVAGTVALVVGTVLGIISGYFGGWVDNFLMRIVDFLYGIPLLPIIILMQVYFTALNRQGIEGGFAGTVIGINQRSGGLFFLFVALGLLNWIGMARLARGQVLSYKNKEFIEAAHALGASNPRILFKHLLPNVFGPLLIAETLAIPGYIFLEAILSFIGLGVVPPTPSWGAMINEGYAGLASNPHLVLLPGIMLATLVLAFNFFGDGLRDAFDPKIRNR